MRPIFIAAFSLIPTTIFAQECESVIALSKVQSVVISDKATVDQHAANFCNEYSKSSGNSSSTSFGASYKFLSASFGQSGASMEQVASRYCSAENSFKSSADAYKQYVESISPNAYDAYAQCIEMSKNNVRYNINAAGILPDEFTMSVSFSSGQANATSATLAYSAPEGITCKWDGTDEKTSSIPSGSTEILKCSRSDSSKRAYVTVVRKDEDNKPMTLSWPAYNADGVPVNQIASLETAIQAVTSTAQQLQDSVNALQTDNANLRAQVTREIAKRKQTWVRNNEACPEGSQRLGTIGVIMLNGDYINNIGNGGKFNEGWTWTHPVLCWFQ
ncbi:hypothetical protein E0H59_13710 [Rhizobium leguminosarum bv. viciae]|nr:hypothetical protein E0H59_13710 [Rhizobium leguminosarum bv. viciae]